MRKESGRRDGGNGGFLNFHRPPYLWLREKRENLERRLFDGDTGLAWARAWPHLGPPWQKKDG